MKTVVVFLPRPPIEKWYEKQRIGRVERSPKTAFSPPYTSDASNISFQDEMKPNILIFFLNDMFSSPLSTNFSFPLFMDTNFHFTDHRLNYTAA